MPSATTRMNITREDAQARARLIEVTSYDVELDLTVGDVTFLSSTVARFRCTEPGAATYVDLVADEIAELELNGRGARPGRRCSTAPGSASTAWPTTTRCGCGRPAATCTPARDCTGSSTRSTSPSTSTRSSRSRTRGGCSPSSSSPTSRPPSRSPSPRRTTGRWSPTSRRPSPSRPASATRPGGSPPTPRISSYITALVAGPYHRVDSEYRDGDRVIPLALYCRASLAAHLDADVILEETRQGFEFFEREFGMPYPFEKYDQLFVPEFNSGAMENAGCVTHHEDYVFRSRVPEVSYERRAVTILHEMAHMWFGDLVTMTWWDDLWLNESFAEWASTLAAAEATRWTSAWTTFANTDKTWAYRQDQLPSTHPIAAEIHDLEDVEVNFDGITYAKGASVLKLLAAWVGRDEFLAGIREYFRAYAWGNTTLADLLGKLEETSGRDLKAWSAEWLETAGVNTLRPVVRGRRRGAVHLVRGGAERAGRVADAALAPAGRRALRPRPTHGLVRHHRVELDVTGARTDVPELVGVDAAGPRAGQRRRPDLRQDPARRAVAAHADRRARRVRGHPAPVAVLVGRLGHDPRRRDVDAGLPDPGARRHRPRDATAR